MKVSTVSDEIRSLEAALGRKLPPPTVLKIDCEGCEWGALEGMRDLWEDKSWRPRLIVLEAFTPFMRALAGSVTQAGTPINTLTLLRQFLPLGYRVWTGDLKVDLTDGLHPDAPQPWTYEELDAAGKARGCGLYVLHFGQIPTEQDLWSVKKGCLES